MATYDANQKMHIQKYFNTEKGKIALRRAQKKYFQKEDVKKRISEKQKKYYEENKDEIKLLVKLRYYKRLLPIINDKMRNKAEYYMTELMNYYDNKINNGEISFKERKQKFKEKFNMFITPTN